MAQRHHLEAIRVELQRLRLVVIGDEQVAAALDQPHRRVVNVQCDQAALDWAEFVAQARNPCGKEGERQGVRHREFDDVLAGRRVAAQHGPGVLQRLQHLHVGAGPGFQGLDAARERRLRHMAQLGRPAETAGLGQAHEIFEPFGFHERHYCGGG